MRKTIYNTQSAFMALVLVALGATSTFATPINTAGGGNLSVANVTGKVVAVTSVPPCISFSGSAMTPSPCTTPPAITPIIINPIDPMFATTGMIKDISSTPIVGWKTVDLNAGGSAIFDLISIVPPDTTVYPLCTATTTSGVCSTGNLTIQQNAPGSVTITFTTAERGYTGSSATGYTPYQGIFTTQLTGGLTQFGCVVTATQDCTTTINSILAFEAAGGTVSSTLSGSESPNGPPVRKPFTGCTVTQGGWGSPSQSFPGTFLNNNFFSTYGAAGVTIGGLNTLTFTTAAAVRAFLPQGGPPSFLNSSQTNPTSRTSAGVFAGQVLALELNVDLQGLGGLVLTGTGTSLDGKTVSQVLAAANIALGGGPLPAGFASYSALNDLIDQLNSSFDGCVADAWALAHLH